MASGMDKLAKELKTMMSASDNRKPKPYDAQAEVLRVEDGIAWVHIPGGVQETPVRLTMDAKKGDMVNIHVANGSAWITGNGTSPPTDNTVANQAKDIGSKAISISDDALTEAIRAFTAADTAESEAARANAAANSAGESATLAYNRANEAYQYANSASEAAEIANSNARIAKSSADAAQTSADAAQLSANNAASAAADAMNAANDAIEDAATANDNALAAQSASSSAMSAATAAQSAADNAQTDATAAYNAAITANTAASGAIESLGIVEDVLGVLNWISEHGEYVLTQDTTVVPSKYYFTRSGSGTSADPYIWSVVTPAAGANPNALGYYELDSVDEAISNYVATHIALASEGLYIQTSDGASTSRVLVSPTNGVILYGPDGSQVAQYGTSTIIGTTTSFNVRISDQEVGFYDQDTRVAYVNGNTLYITQSVVLDEMKLGQDKWVWKYDNRDDSIFLKWIG